MENQEKCHFNSSKCGNYFSKQEDEEPLKLEVSQLKDLKEDVGPMFGADIVITEGELIRLRSEITVDADDWICKNHKYQLGKGFRPSTLCKYFEHTNSNAKGSKITWAMYKFVKELDFKFVLGSLVCVKCRKKVQLMMDQESNDVDDDDSDNDLTFVPGKACLDDKARLEKREQLDCLANILGVERIRFQINSNVQDLSTSSLNYFRHMHNVMQNNFTHTFCSLVAPGQEEEFEKMLTEQETKIDPVVTHLRESFNTCTSSKARRAVLMLVPKTYSKAKVCELFDCSLYEVTTARAVLKEFGACGEEVKKEREYSRLSVDKARHFIDFLFSTGLLQETAYGTTKLKFENGDKVTVSSTILNGINEHAVKEYIIYCKEINYDRLGRTTLLQMLTKMKPHIRKKLSGVDTFVVEGIEAFESVRLCVKLLKDNSEAKKLLKRINQAENYLKARYGMHCSNNDACISHCINHALSHPTDKDFLSDCDINHDRNCAECLNVVECITLLKSNLSQLPASHEREVAEWEVDSAKQQIMHWQKHILRGVQQAKARAKSFNVLAASYALWIRDYAQKYLPTKTLESMAEYFGKNGITISVEVFITKIFDVYYKHVYLVSLQKSDQGILDTLCIADVVLAQFSKDCPDIKRIDLKTDNAGSYHGNGVVECMYVLAKKRGITLSTYNYNEAQLGKDQCDREAAIFKKSVEKWLLTKETNKISNPQDLLNAVLSGGGPKNTKICVVEIDHSVVKLESVRTISNISYYHSMELQENGILYREYFDIGPGKFIDYDGINFVNGASFVVDWKSSNTQGTPMAYDTRNEHRTYPCPEVLCILEFKNELDMIRHIATANHQYVHIKTGMDRAISHYVQQKDVQNLCNEETMPYYVEHEDTTHSQLHKIYCRGWARKVRRVGRISPKQKQFVETLFNNGAITKTKLSAEQMVEKMKNHKVNGQYFFTPIEYLKISQVRSLISRIKNNNNDPTRDIVPMPEDEGIVQNLDEICDFRLFDSDGEDFEGFDPV